MSRTLPIAAFWAGLYAACALVALAVTPGVPEALGFALPPLMAAFTAFWLARRHTPRVQFAIALAAALVLMIGAVRGTQERGHALGHETAQDTAAISVG